MADKDKLQQALDAVDGTTKPPAPNPMASVRMTKLTPPKQTIANVAKVVTPLANKTAAVKVTEIKDDFAYDTAMHMAFIGVGQGGGKIAQSFWDLGYRRVGAFNTTDGDFEGLEEAMPKLSLNIGGAAKNMDVARKALQQNEEEVHDLLTRAWGSKFDCAIICVGLGGGTGGGTCLPFVQMARKYMETKGLPPRVGALVSLPSIDEGQQVARNAVLAFQELAKAGVSPLIIIDNDKIDALYQPAMSQLLPLSNTVVSQLLHLFNQLAATKSSHVTFDRAELTQLLDSGIVAMGSADFTLEEIGSPADISAKIKGQLADSVLADVDLRTGTKAACIFVAAPQVLDTYSKEYFAAGFTMLNRIVGSNHPEGTVSVVHRGIYVGGDEGLQCYTMVGSLAPPIAKLEALAREGGIRSTPIVNTTAKHLKVD